MDLDLDSTPALDYLSLLKAELVEHIRRARAVLDGDSMQDAVRAAVVVQEAMQQLQGVLRTLGLDTLTLLAQEIGRAVQGLGELSDERRDGVVATLSNGLDLLREGLESRAAGRPEPFWGLVSAVNELRAGTSLPLLSESCLFAPGLEDWLKVRPVTEGGDDAEVREAAGRARAVLHRGMFLWYSEREPERGLLKLRHVARDMQKAVGNGRLLGLFQTLEAAMAGMADQRDPPAGAVRRVLADIDLLLKRLVAHGERTAAESLSPCLYRNLLYLVATSQSTHPKLQAVRRSHDVRLLAVRGLDGREEAARHLLAQLQDVRSAVEQVEDGLDPGPLTQAVQRLSDGLALAQLAHQRGRLERPLAALHRFAAGGREPDPLPDLNEALVALASDLRSQAPGAMATDRLAAELAAASGADVELAALEGMEAEVSETDDELELLAALAEGAGEVDALADATVEGLQPLEAEVLAIFRDEAPEKVEALRQQYVAWSTDRADPAALGAVLWVLDSLKSTARLVGADTLSEVCWVMEAALRECRDGALRPTDDVLAVLDDGVEMVEALVAAQVGGVPVEGDPRLVEQRIYALLTPDLAAQPDHPPPSLPSPPMRHGAQPVAPGARAESPLAEPETFGGGLELVELFAEEARDLADALREGLRGLEEDPASAVWLMEMRRALRALATAAGHAELPRLRELCDASDGFLSQAPGADERVGPLALSLAREVTDAVTGAVEALRQERRPHLPADLIDRLRRGGAGAASAPAAVAVDDRDGECTPTPVDPILTQRVIERASGAGLCHLQLEEQVAVLREQVGRVEGILALLRRLPAGEGGAALPPRVATALADLGSCADRLHETGLRVSAQLRAQGHHLTGLQQGLAAVFAGSTGPIFADLLLVGVGESVYAIPAMAIESVRRLASDLIPPEGDVLDLRGRSFVYHHLAGLLRVARAVADDSVQPRSVVLAHFGDCACALGVDGVIGHRTLLVENAEGETGNPPWLAGVAALGGEREAPVVDLGQLLASA